MAPDTDDLDPDGFLEAIADAVIAAKEHGGDPELAGRIAALADGGEDGAGDDTDVWDEGDDQ